MTKAKTYLKNGDQVFIGKAAYIVITYAGRPYLLNTDTLAVFVNHQVDTIEELKERLPDMEILHVSSIR